MKFIYLSGKHEDDPLWSQDIVAFKCRWFGVALHFGLRKRPRLSFQWLS